MPTFDKKGIYHSDLVKAGDVTVTITTEGPQKSKYNGKPDWVGFKCDGGDHSYSVENPACGEALTGLKGQTVTLRASGREADARIEVISGGKPAQQPHQKPNQAPTNEPNHQTPPPPPADREKIERATFNKMRRTVASVGLMMQTCISASRAAFHKAFEVPKDAEREFDTAHMDDIRATANTIFIESKNYIAFSDMPVKTPDPKPATPPPPPPPPPEPEMSDADCEF